MPPPEPRGPTTARPEPPNAEEAEENNLKNNFMKTIEALKEEMKNFLKEIEEKRNKKLEEKRFYDFSSHRPEEQWTPGQSGCELSFLPASCMGSPFTEEGCLKDSYTGRSPKSLHLAAVPAQTALILVRMLRSPLQIKAIPVLTFSALSKL